VNDTTAVDSSLIDSTLIVPEEGTEPVNDTEGLKPAETKVLPDPKSNSKPENAKPPKKDNEA
jgi:hypothetical protein